VSPLVEVLSDPRLCPYSCHDELDVGQRAQGIAAMMLFDDALRGWGYEPQYEPRAHGIFKEARMRNDPDYRGIPVRDNACIYTRLVGFAVHELIHGVLGEPGEPNWGVPWGLPYGVPEDLPEGEEAEFLFPYNLAEACAWSGVKKLAVALFDIHWPLLTARDVGTYGFFGGNAIVEVPPGFRAIPHWDRQITPEVYYPQARALEAQAEAYMTDEVVTEWCDEIHRAAALGAERRREVFPDPNALARLTARPPRRNEMCICGSGKKYKRCCSARGHSNV